MRYLLPSIAICAVALMIAACFDPDPAEISIIATKNGMRKGCVVQVFNTKGIQIAEVATDFNGIGYVKDVAPGTYTLRFTDSQRNLYPAELEITVGAGESLPINVELTEGPAPEDAATE